MIQGISALITSIATIILAFLTARYVRLTNHMLEETRASRGPNVYVDIELTSFEIKLLVGNSGTSPAHNIHLSVSDSIPWRDNSSHGGFKKLGIVKEGISYLAPGRTLKYIAGYYDWKELEKSNSNAEFIITFADHTRKKQRIEFMIGMDQYKAILFESFKKPGADIAAALERMESRRSSEKSMNLFLHGIGKKNCTHCGEQIAASAKKCPHCMEFIENKENNEST